jgi:hypothetical protein
MWTRATELSGNVVWLNLSLARSIVRLAYETAHGYGAKTVVVFDSSEQWTVIEKPEVLLAAAEAAKVDSPDLSGPADRSERRSAPGSGSRR